MERSASALAVEAAGLTRRFDDVVAVGGVDLQVPPGTILGIIGPSGSGKTTTIRMLMGFLRPTSGHMSVLGTRPGDTSVRDRIGYLPEERGLYRDVAVLDTLTYFGSLKGLRSGDARRRATALLDEVGLAPVMRRRASELSRGMQQKAQVVATVLHEPDLLILDEPFQGLDPVNAELLRGVVLAQRERGAAVVMSTHRMEEAEALCDRIVLIDQGRRLLYGALADVRREFSDGAVLAQGDGIPDRLGGLRSASIAGPTDGAIRFVLNDKATPRDLFRELAAQDVTVDRFEVAVPSLDEIFIKVVAAAR